VADTSKEQDFQRRPQWLNKSLLDLWRWTEAEFLNYTEGSAIRRIGYQRWQRNIAVALGNAPYDLAIIDALQHQWPQSDELVQEHIQWALGQQQKKSLLQQNLLSRQTDRLVRAIQKGLPRDA
jgi:epoxyqueuosine reductase